MFMNLQVFRYKLLFSTSYFIILCNMINIYTADTNTNYRYTIFLIHTYTYVVYKQCQTKGNFSKNKYK